jgi:DNA-binding NtrC family response regulator
MEGARERMDEGSARPRVLIVDDTRFDREVALDAIGDVAQVETAGSAEEALVALRRAPVDLVLTDLHLPGLSGIDLLARVRAEHSDTDVILITAHASVDSAVQALRMGAADYLNKPVRGDELALVVRRTLDRRRLSRERAPARPAAVEDCRAPRVAQPAGSPLRSTCCSHNSSPAGARDLPSGRQSGFR